ncbi:hypothetical protein EJ07DRAFT_151728 [Lizonia empirigonia]|nr:hypothetical protein EJ07DRAFT_151728 [Lizonia empirigonia]
MASVDLACGEGVSRLSFDKDVLLDGFSVPGNLRRDSSSTTASGLPIPRGHYTQRISGNCPNCRHHHRSIKIHFRDVNNTSRLVDVHCERCKKLWLGPGSRNSTRISLQSHETIDKPPPEPELRTTLAHMIRSATQVAALSRNLPNIQEGASPEASHGPFIQSPVRTHAHGYFASPVNQTPNTTLNAVPDPPVIRPAVSPSKRIIKTKSNNLRTTSSPHFVLRLKRRFIGRLLKLYNEPKMEIAEHGEPQALNPVPVSDTTPLSPSNILPENREEQDQAVLNDSAENMEAPISHAVATGDLKSLMIVDQEVINAMSPEQRIAFLRSQITAFSARHNARSNTVTTPCDHASQEDPLDTLATWVANHNSLLTGTGNCFGDFSYMDVFRQNGSTIARQSLDISETRFSDGVTAVGHATTETVRETLYPVAQLPEQAHRWSTQSVVQSWNQIRRDRGDLRSSFDSSATIGAESTAATRDRLSHHRFRQSMPRNSMLYNTEASASQSRIQSLRHNNDGSRRPISLPSPPPPAPANEERRPSA